MIPAPVVTSIELAFFRPGSSVAVAQSLSRADLHITAGQVARIWSDAKRAGRLPNIKRPPGGPKLQRRA